MKSNELMLGDWVYDTILKGNTRVEMLSLFGIKGDFHENVYNENTFEPIPITPKILKKNGFVYIEKTEDITHYYLGGRNSCRLGLHIGTNNKGDYWVNTNYNDIYGLKYVHEPQHAFRLFKLEKDIVL